MFSEKFLGSENVRKSLLIFSFTVLKSTALKMFLLAPIVYNLCLHKKRVILDRSNVMSRGSNKWTWSITEATPMTMLGMSQHMYQRIARQRKEYHACS